MRFTTALLAGGLVSFAAHALRINDSPSMPMGVWYLSWSAQHVYRPGEIVEACPHIPAAETVYLDQGPCPDKKAPVLKRIVAVAADQVSVSPVGVAVNGTLLPDSAPLAHDSAGRPLHAYPTGTYTLRTGYVWLAAPDARSLDSRYYGPVSISDIGGVMSPVVVWR